MPADIANLLRSTRTIAVVGLSPDPFRASFGVAQFMQEHGYRIVPVNPNVAEVLGEKSYADLESIPFPVDMVNIFRRPEAVPPFVDAAIRIGAKSVWMQEGIVHEAAAAKAEQAGLDVVMDRCLLKEHIRLRM